MILSRYAYVTIGTRNISYWRALGYDVKKSDKIKTLVSELPKIAKTLVSCRCDDCGKKYLRQFKSNTDICFICNAKKVSSFFERIGSKHPRWRSDKSAYRGFANQVRWLTEKTYRAHISTINPHNLPRAVNGTNGAYQLDHIVSVKRAFELGMTIEETADVSNLQLIPWEENIAKSWR